MTEGTPRATLDTEAPPLIANRYEVRGLLGVGGMGSVYHAFDRELREAVALKFLRRDLLDSEEALDLFRQEVRLARRVTHRNVARTFDIGEHAGERFLTMEYIEGESLARSIAKRGAESSRRAIEIALELCSGLEAAHAAGVVHRDLKPENILVERGKRIVITDFGIACARTVDTSPTEGIVGTLAYISPEQLANIDDIDGRADLYALGAVLYEMLTGVLAWPDASIVSVTNRLLQPPPDPRAKNSGLSDHLAAVVTRCMAKDRDDRFPDAAAVTAALQAVPAGHPTSRDSQRLIPPTVLAFRVAPLVQPDDRTVAVLPFKNLGPADDDYLADELTDDLIDGLSSTRQGLKVRPRRAITRHLGLDLDLQALGRALDVQVIVEGTVRRRDGVVRIATRALSVAENLQLWARKFERPASELLAINDEVANGVASALDAARETPVRAAITDSEALNLYLAARQGLRAEWLGFGDLDRVVDKFEAALARAPDDVAILSGVAMARARQFNFASMNQRATDIAPAREAAARAIAIAPQLAEPWLASATVHQVCGDWVLATHALRATLLRAPGLQKAHELLGAIELEVGHVDEGLLRMRSVLAIDPDAHGPRFEMARVNALLGRWDEVDALLAPHAEHASDRRGRAFFCARSNLWRRVAVHTLDITIDRADPVLGLLALFVDALEHGLHAATCGLAERAASIPLTSRLRPLLYQVLAELAAFEGDEATTLDALGHAHASALYDITWIDRCPLFDPLRQHPRFRQIRDGVLAAVLPIRAALRAPMS